MRTARRTASAIPFSLWPLVLSLLCSPASAQYYHVLWNFGSGADGIRPQAGLLLVSNTLYGTTYYGGALNDGTAFRLNTGGSGYTVLKTFGNDAEGMNPQTGLVSSGNTLYGTTPEVNNYYDGTLFALSTDGNSYAVLASFDIRHPRLQELALSGNTLYCATAANQEMIFRINTDGTGYQCLMNFPGWPLTYPVGALVVDGDVLYGTTTSGGSAGQGTVFQINTDGTGFAVLKTFTNGADGGQPLAGLTLADGVLYGTTSTGGTSNLGTVFRLNPDGTGFSVLWSQTDAPPDNGLRTKLAFANGTLYGMTYRGGGSQLGSIFSLRVDGSGYAVLKSFTGRPDGALPYGGVICSGNSLYGTTSSGGTFDEGTVFRLDAGPPVILQPPQDQAAILGASVTFTAALAPNAAATFSQWVLDTTNTLVDATNTVLALTNVQAAQAGTYAVVLSNQFGMATSAPASLSVRAYPVIQVQPAAQADGYGGEAQFSVAADGTPPLSYQWYFNVTNALAGATNTLLSLTNLQAAQAGDYSVVVSNPYAAVTSSPANLTLFQPVVRAATEAALRAAVAAGGRATFACDGAITLSGGIVVSNSSVLDGAGHTVTVDGLRATRLFTVAAGASLTLSNLTLANGSSQDGLGGGAILNAGALAVWGCTFRDNQAAGLSPAAGGSAASPGDGQGGAILNHGLLTVGACTFRSNLAVGCVPLSLTPGGRGQGGAIGNDGVLIVNASTFDSNLAAGGAATMYGTTGLSGGDAQGGAICNASVGLVGVAASTFVGNSATGGLGANGGSGGSTFPNPPLEDLNGRPGGSGGNAWGGSLYNAGGAWLVNCTSAANSAAGGSAGNGGDAGQGLYEGDGWSYDRSGYPGGGGAGGSATAAIYDASGNCALTNCTLAANLATSGSGGAGGAASDGGPSGPAGTVGSVQGCVWGARLVNCLLLANATGDSFANGGHNLVAASTNGLAGPLADNGGPTWTMALPPGSPAIDAADTASAPATDQRGLPRPVGFAADIGAFEVQVPPPWPPILRAGLLPNGALNVQAFGSPSRWLALLTSTNLMDWTPLATNQLPANSLLAWPVTLASDPQRFFRLVVP